MDANRIAHELSGGVALNEINLGDYDTIVSVSEYDASYDYGHDYLIREVDGRLYCFEYKSENNIFVTVNLVFGVMFFLSIFLLIYVSHKVIAPFSRMDNLTTELAKGNLSVPIKEEKSRYFGSFLWGMDMLRNKLEDDKVRELELLKEKKTLILSLSHDVKTPLSAIELYTKAVKDGIYDTEEKKEQAIEGIEKNVAEIKHYVNEIVNASRDDFLNLICKPTDVYLKDIINSITGYYNDKMAQLHTEFVVNRYDNCIVYADEDRLIEVIQNVIENAIKYGDGKLITISFDEEEDCKLITIFNSGCTLKEDELTSIFDSFYRGSNVKNQKGSGLGLYICKDLMHKMDGDIFAKINDGGFAVTLVVRKM